MVKNTGKSRFIRKQPRICLSAILSFLLLTLPACAGRPTQMPTVTLMNTPAASATAKAAPLPTVTAPTTPAATTPTPSASAAAGGTATSSFNLTSFQWFDERNGWGVTQDLHLLRTADGGTTWLDVTPTGLIPGVGSTFFLDPQNAWFLPTVYSPPPTSGTLYHTTDGGATWTSNSVPFAASQLNFVSPQDGWASQVVECGQGPGGCVFLLYQTTDGGATWRQLSEASSPQPVPAEAAQDLPAGTIYTPGYQLAFQDATSVWTLGGLPDGEQALYVSRDSAHTWQKVELPAPGLPLATNPKTGQPVPAQLNPPIFRTAQEGYLMYWAVESGVQIYHTQDGGQTWQTAPSELVFRDHLNNLQPPQFATALDWYIRADDADSQQIVLCVTHDGGKSWNVFPTNLVPGGTPYLIAYQFIHAGAGWRLVGEAGAGGQAVTRLSHTLDDGRTWDLLSPVVSGAQPEATSTPIPTAPVAGLAEASPTTIPTAIFTPPAGGFPFVSSMTWIDAQTGYAQTNGSTLLRSADGGSTWRAVTQPFPDPVNYAFLGPDHIWAVENHPDANSTLFRSADGGRTWYRSPTPFRYATLTFADPINGWAEDDSAGCGAGNCWIKLYRTGDGGRTWKQIVPPLTFGRETGLQAGTFHITSGQAFTFQGASTIWLSQGYFDANPTTLMVSHDTGQTWQAVYLALPPDMTPVQGYPVTFLDDKVGFTAVGFTRPGRDPSQGYPYGLEIFVTQDGGATWTPRPALEAGMHPVFATAQDWALPCNGQICVTHDSGATWQASPIPGGPENMYGLTFVDAKHGWFFSGRPLANNEYYNLLYRTTDGGKTWEQVEAVMK